MAKTFICDVIPGGGKSSAIINMMNEQKDKRFIYIAPYKDEDKRIVKVCKERGFVVPKPKGRGGRLDNLHTLLREGKNVASTHALFARYNQETIDLIKAGNYCLVMDEAFQIAEILSYTKSDIEIILNANLIDTSGDRVRWVADNYIGGSFSDLKAYAETGYLQSFKNLFFYWYYPPDVFNAFSEAYVLTYLFDCQFLRYYFDTHGIRYSNVWVDFIDGKYTLVDYPTMPAHASSLKGKIHILDNEKINDIGDARTSLSSTWYKNAEEKDKAALSRMRKNIQNYFRNIVKRPSADVLWTTFKSGQEAVAAKGFIKGFAPFNARATNRFRDKDAVAYAVNVFPNPNYVQFFKSKGARVNQDGYALSEMIQFIWRSAIREGKDIWLYIPSKRMRGLLTKWLDELAEGKIHGEQ